MATATTIRSKPGLLLHVETCQLWGLGWVFDECSLQFQSSSVLWLLEDPTFYILSSAMQGQLSTVPFLQFSLQSRRWQVIQAIIYYQPLVSSFDPLKDLTVNVRSSESFRTIRKRNQAVNVMAKNGREWGKHSAGKTVQPLSLPVKSLSLNPQVSKIGLRLFQKCQSFTQRLQHCDVPFSGVEAVYFHH